MSSRRFGFLLAAVLFVPPLLLVGQNSPPIPVQEIIQRFAANEEEFQRVRLTYSYRQDIRVQELNRNDKVVGEFHLVSEIAPDASGKPAEKILERSPITLKSIAITPADLEDIRNTQTVALTTDQIEKYDIKYLGTENVNAIRCYTLEVKPKNTETGQRYFEGKIWVEDHDLHIIKSSGKAVPNIRTNGGENLFPHFEMYRERIDNYWLPSSIQALDSLQFSSGTVRVRQITKFGSYRKF